MVVHMQKSFLIRYIVPGFGGFLLLWDTKSTIKLPPPHPPPSSFKLIKYAGTPCCPHCSSRT
jgi:hypothetical protein